MISLAVILTQTIDIVALKSDQKEIISFLQQEGSVEFSEVDDNEIFAAQNGAVAAAGADMESKILVVNAAIDILKRHSDEKGSLFDGLAGKREVSSMEYADFELEQEKYFEIAQNICELDEKIKTNNHLKTQLELGLGEILPWATLDVPLNYKGTQSTACFIGYLPNQQSVEEIAKAISSLEEETEPSHWFHISIISSDKYQTRILAICMKSDASRLKDDLDKIEFTLPLQRIKGIPKQEIDAAKAETKLLTAEQESLSQQLRHMDHEKTSLEFLHDLCRIQMDRGKASGQIGTSGYTFLIKGFVLESHSENLRAKLEKRFSCIVNTALPEQDGAPVSIKNNWFSEPVEDVVISFGYPTATETDPTAITSIFYYLLFGLMFSDAAYGFILSLATGILLLKFKKMNATTNKFLRLFFWCGLSTVFWGVVFSSYFGDVVDIVSQNFFGVHLTIPPLWFAPLKDPMKLLVFCLGLGLIHLSMGYVMNAVNSIKNKNFSAIIYDAVFPMTFMLGLLIFGMTSEMFRTMAGFSLTLSDGTKNVCLIIAAVSGVGVILTGGRESKNIVKRLLKGIFAFYNVIAGWISDTLSYSRLLALGLATGVIASVVNTLGAMIGKGFVAAIGFILIFIVGHSINFAINILGSYVHSNRLEYVEFFGKFFDGGGRQFKPFAFNTKYYEIMEDGINE